MSAPNVKPAPGDKGRTAAAPEQRFHSAPGAHIAHQAVAKATREPAPWISALVRVEAPEDAEGEDEDAPPPDADEPDADEPPEA